MHCRFVHSIFFSLGQIITFRKSFQKTAIVYKIAPIKSDGAVHLKSAKGADISNAYQ